MKKKLQRCKGGGRKLADGRISKTRLIKMMKKWFQARSSVNSFLNSVGISKQTYYRFLNKNLDLKDEIYRTRKARFEAEKARMKNALAYLKQNPNASFLECYFHEIINVKPLDIHDISLSL